MASKHEAGMPASTSRQSPSTSRSAPSRNVVVVGAGLTGCTVAHRLATRGVRSVVYERAAAPGGLIRCARLEGVLYEPHGSHVFHTADTEVWQLAGAVTPFNDYRHR